MFIPSAFFFIINPIIFIAVPSVGGAVGGRVGGAVGGGETGASVAAGALGPTGASVVTGVNGGNVPGAHSHIPPFPMIPLSWAHWVADIEPCCPPTWSSPQGTGVGPRMNTSSGEVTILPAPHTEHGGSPPTLLQAKSAARMINLDIMMYRWI